MKPSPSVIRIALTVIPVLFAILSPLGAQTTRPADENLPVFDLEAVEVVHSETEFAPEFSTDSPSFTYFEVPELPRANLILVLEFMDQYRDAQIPGPLKWAGVVTFPVIDGYGNEFLKLICLYYYDGRMFGYDPSTSVEWSKRFAVPIQYEDRSNPDVLFRFATSYVEEMYPGGEEEVWYEETVDPEYPEEGGSGYYETISVDPGRIAPVLSSQKGKAPHELVRLIYRYSSANTNPASESAMGRLKKDRREPFSWKAFFSEFGSPPDPLVVAANLVAPRWSGILKLHFEQSLLGIVDWEASRKIMIFNIGQAIYAYDPRLGVWKTKGTLNDLGDIQVLSGKINHPDIPKIARLEVIPLERLEKPDEEVSDK